MGQGACSYGAARPPRPTSEDMKSIFASKTFWTQVLALAVMLFPEVRLWVSENPVEFTAAWAALNTLVRFATSGKVSLAGGGEGKGETAGPLGGANLLIVMGATAGLCFTALPSCSIGEYPISGSVTFRDESTGAKAGLTIYPRARVARSEKCQVRSEK